LRLRPPVRKAGPPLRTYPAVDQRSLVRLVTPVLAVISGAFALWQLFLAGLSVRLGSYAFGAFYAVMGIAGLAVATSLWRVWRGK